MLGLSETVETEVYAEHHCSNEEGKYGVDPQAGACDAADRVVVIAGEKRTDKRCEAVGEAYTGKNGDVEEIIYKRSRGQRVGGIMTHHDVVGEADSNVAELTLKKRKRQLTDSSVIVGVYGYELYQILIAVAAENAEQIKEQINEVEVERERTDSGELRHSFGGSHHCHAFYLLGVPCGKADENEDAND